VGKARCAIAAVLIRATARLPTIFFMFAACDARCFACRDADAGRLPPLYYLRRFAVRISDGVIAAFASFHVSVSNAAAQDATFRRVCHHAAADCRIQDCCVSCFLISHDFGHADIFHFIDDIFDISEFQIASARRHISYAVASSAPSRCRPASFFARRSTAFRDVYSSAARRRSLPLPLQARRASRRSPRTR